MDATKLIAAAITASHEDKMTQYALALTALKEMLEADLRKVAIAGDNEPYGFTRIVTNIECAHLAAQWCVDRGVKVPA